MRFYNVCPRRFSLFWKNYTKWDRANNFFTKRQQVNHSFVSIGLQTLWKSKAIFRLTTLHEIVLVQLALNEYFHFMYFTPYGVFFDLLSLSICLNSPTNGLIYLSFCYFISILCVMHNFLVSLRWLVIDFISPNKFYKFSWKYSMKFTTEMEETSWIYFSIFCSQNLLPWQPSGEFRLKKSIVLFRRQVGDIFSNS